jgi:hypothetical protein
MMNSNRTPGNHLPSRVAGELPRAAGEFKHQATFIAIGAQGIPHDFPEREALLGIRFAHEGIPSAIF